MISLRNQIPVFMVALGLLLLSGANFLYWSMHPLSISADQSVYVQSGLLLLQGKVPYLDFFDLNLKTLGKSKLNSREIIK